MKEICGNCQWFVPEPSVSLYPNAPVVKISDMNQSLGDKIAARGGSQPPVYGKCRAMYQDRENVTREFNTGMLSNSPCQAKDDYGYPLFIL
jgi:hypothetical protein